MRLYGVLGSVVLAMGCQGVGEIQGEGARPGPDEFQLRLDLRLSDGQGRVECGEYGVSNLNLHWGPVDDPWWVRVDVPCSEEVVVNLPSRLALAAENTERSRVLGIQSLMQ